MQPDGASPNLQQSSSGPAHLHPGFAQTCPHCKEREEEDELAALWTYFSGPWTARKFIRATKLIFIMLVGLVFTFKVLSHIRPITLVKTLVYDMLASIRVVATMLFIRPISATRTLLGWSLRQMVALLQDLWTIVSFVPILTRISARIVGMLLVMFFVAPYLARFFLTKPLNWYRRKKLEYYVNKSLGGRVDPVVFAEALSHFEVMETMRASQEHTAGSDNSRRNRRRRS